MKFLRPFLGAHEFINGEERWCLWLKDAAPSELRALPEIMKRVELVRQHRRSSSRETTRELAKTPTLFGEIRQPSNEYLLIPSVSSENRPYIPMGFMSENVIGSNLVLLVPDATNYHFGVLSSTMHMAWVRQVCGRLKSDYRYSNKLVYNNFPWPDTTIEQRSRIEERAQAVLAAREPHVPPLGLATFADLYDPLTMPQSLLRAHSDLDRVVEKCYRSEPFHSDRDRVEFLFALYEKITAPLVATSKVKRRKKPDPTQGKSTPESEARAAHFYFKEQPLPYTSEAEE